MPNITITVGWVLALVGLVVSIVLAIVGQLALPLAGLFILAFLARLIP